MPHVTANQSWGSKDFSFKYHFSCVFFLFKVCFSFDVLIQAFRREPSGGIWGVCILSAYFWLCSLHADMLSRSGLIVLISVHGMCVCVYMCMCPGFCSLTALRHSWNPQNNPPSAPSSHSLWLLLFWGSSGLGGLGFGCVWECPAVNITFLFILSLPAQTVVGDAGSRSLNK